jgi:hypothetical protein
MRAARSVAPAEDRISLAGGMTSAAFLGLLVIIVDQLVQVSTAPASLAFGDPLSRFQMAASLAARMAPVILGFLIVAGAAFAGGRRDGLAVLRWAAAGMAVILGVAAVLLWFDGASVKPGVAAEELSAFRDQWVRGEVFSILSAGFFGWFALGLARMR